MTTAADGTGTTTVAMITWTVMIVALVALVLFVMLGFYRARYSADREARYRALAEEVGAAQTRTAESALVTADELIALRTELQANRAELAQVTKRLTELERLLSQIG
ncbi:hypothetical protein [Plantactinospora sp. GCM10030261]|uniref:hypothetical protein n=1 Tax=Plantactinospora sp. GCM10030261 TaxID=3273420 RepID=UPI00361E6E30